MKPNPRYTLDTDLTYLQKRTTYSPDPPGQFEDLYRNVGALGGFVQYSPYEVQGWRELIATHQSATSGMVAQQSRRLSRNDGVLVVNVKQDKYFSTPGGTWSHELRGNFGGVNSAPGAPSDAALMTSANNQALEALIKQLVKAQQNLQGLVVLGELSKTLRSIRHPLTALHDGIYAYLARVKKRASKRVITVRQKRDIVANTWLEFQYGMIPTANDLDGLMKDVAERNSYRAPVKRISGSGRAQKIIHIDGQIEDTVGTVHFIRRKHIKVEEMNVRYVGEVGTSGDNRGITSFGNIGISTSLGLTLRDFVPALWELIPYSFLVDYFTNIGNIIQARSYDAADTLWLEKQTYGRVVDSYQDITYTLDGFGPGPPAVYYTGVSFSPGSTGGYETVSKTREKYAGSLAPKLEFKIPGLSSKKWLNITALAITHRHVVNSLK